MATIKKTMTRGEDMAKLEPSHPVRRNVKWCRVLENSVEFLKKLNIQLPYTQQIHLREVRTYVYTKACTQMFTAAFSQ